MAFCNKCGNQLPDGANNCPNCGAPAGNTQQNTQNAQNFVNNMMNTNDTTSQFDPQDINDNKGMSVLAYIGFLLLVLTRSMHAITQTRDLYCSCWSLQ